MTKVKKIDIAPETTEEHLIGWAVSIISNVSGGNWEEQSEEWQDAVKKWFVEFHGWVGGKNA